MSRRSDVVDASGAGYRVKPWFEEGSGQKHFQKGFGMSIDSYRVV